SSSAANVAGTRGERAIPGLGFGFDIHLAGHLPMQRVAEPLAIVPVYAGPRSGEGDRRCLLWADFHGDAVTGHREAVRQVFDQLHVGHNDGDFIAFIHFEVRHTEDWGNGRHVDTHLVAVADHLAATFERDAIFLRLLACVFPHGVIPRPGLFGAYLAAV